MHVERYIDTNGTDITVEQPLLHSDIGGDNAIDGGVTKNGAGTMTVSGVSGYTGGTVINGGTLCRATFTPPALVGNQSFDEPPAGPMAQGTVIANSGGGTGMDGSVNHLDNPFADPVSTTITAGKFNNGVSIDGLGSSIDIASRIVDQSGGGSWTFSAWVNIDPSLGLGSAMMVKSEGGSTWQGGHSEFYLANSDHNANGELPTAVRSGGGFVQGNQSVVDNNWHMVTFVSNGGAKTRGHPVNPPGWPRSLQAFTITAPCEQSCRQPYRRCCCCC